jgi:hypothetical protein
MWNAFNVECAMGYRLLLSAALTAATLSLGTPALAENANQLEPAEIEDRCRTLVDRFDEAVRTMAQTEEVTTARRLRRAGAAACFSHSDSNILAFGLEDLQAALKKIGVSADAVDSDTRQPISRAIEGSR